MSGTVLDKLDVTVVKCGRKVRFEFHTDAARDFANCIDDYLRAGDDTIEVDLELGIALAEAMREHGLLVIARRRARTLIRHYIRLAEG